MATVLVVDDEPQLLRALQIHLRAHGLQVVTAADGDRALRAVRWCPPDLVVLDLGLPDMDGCQAIRSLRSWTAVPIIVLSGRSDCDEKVTAFDAGADDYVTKPIAMNEFLARVRAALRRPAVGGGSGHRRGHGNTVVIGAYTVELDRAVVRRTDADDPGAPTRVRLTPTEWKILSELVRQSGRLVTGERLLTRVWGPGHEHDTNYLRVYVCALRHKLERDPSRPRHLITQRGIGYRFDP